MKKIILVLLMLGFVGIASGDLNTPKNLQTGGQVTTAGVVCALNATGTNGYTIILDGSAVGTSTITVAINVYDPVPNSPVYVTPVTIGGVTQPITLTNATTQVINIPGSFPGIQVQVTSFGTATGTFTAFISTY